MSWLTYVRFYRTRRILNKIATLNVSKQRLFVKSISSHIHDITRNDTGLTSHHFTFEDYNAKYYGFYVYVPCVYYFNGVLVTVNCTIQSTSYNVQESERVATEICTSAKQFLNDNPTLAELNIKKHGFEVYTY